MSGGIVFRVRDALAFLPATVALEVRALPTVTRIPGAPPELLGLALIDGEAMPVVRAFRGDETRAAAAYPLQPSRPPAVLVCNYLGERFALAGIEILGTGTFADVGEGRVAFGEDQVVPFDIGAALASLRVGGWDV